MIHKNESELNSEDQRLAIFIDIIGEGRGNRPLSNVLEETECRVGSLILELEEPLLTQKRDFQAPPIASIITRINQLAELLKQNTSQSALVLREVLGPIRLGVIHPDIG